MIITNNNQLPIPTKELVDILEHVTNGHCVVESTTTQTHNVAVCHVHSRMVESAVYPDQKSRTDFVLTSLRHEIKRRGYEIVHSNSSVMHVEAYPTCTYERDSNVQRIFKQFSRKAN